MHFPRSYTPTYSPARAAGDGVCLYLAGFRVDDLLLNFPGPVAGPTGRGVFRIHQLLSFVG